MYVYASVADLTTVNPTTGNQWMAAAPSNAVALIRQASNLVYQATRMDDYYTYPLIPGQPVPSSSPCGMGVGMPSDPTVAQAFNDAVCQQVLTWSTSGINPDAGLHGQVAIISSQAASDGGNATYVTDLSQEWLERETTGLCDAALVILQNAGMGSNTPGIW